jgi:hypothetical protein
MLVRYLVSGMQISLWWPHTLSLAVCVSVKRMRTLWTHFNSQPDTQSSLSRSWLFSCLKRPCSCNKQRCIPVTIKQLITQIIFSQFISLCSTTSHNQLSCILDICCQHSIVSTATCYRLDGPGIESWWEWDCLHSSRLALGANPAPWGPIQPPVE